MAKTVELEIKPDLIEQRMLSLAILQQAIIILEDQDPIGEDYKNRQKAAKTGELLISYLKNFFSDSQHIDEEDRKAFKAFRQATWGILEIVERKLHIQERRRKEASVALRALTHNIDAILQDRESRDKANTAQMVDQLLSISDMMTVLGTLAVRAHSLTPTQIDAYNNNVNQLVKKYRLDIPITEKYKDNGTN